MLASSSATRLATTHFSLQVLTNSRYFCRLSKKRKLRCGSRSPAGDRGRRSRERPGGRAGADSMIAGRAVSRPMRLLSHEAADAVERLGGDAAAVAQPRGELAVVDGAAAEGGFGKPGLPAIVGDFLQQLLGVHAKTPRLRVSLRSRARPLRRAYVMRRTGTANQLRQEASTTKHPIRAVGGMMGTCPIGGNAHVSLRKMHPMYHIMGRIWGGGKCPTRGPWPPAVNLPPANPAPAARRRRSRRCRRGRRTRTP